MKLVRHAIAWAILASTALAPLAAACSRPIKVPVAANGHSVTVSAAGVGGLFPEMLTLVGARAGCTFAWSVVPRVRQETMFARGQADVLVAATEVQRRGRHGIFIPMFETRPTMISVDRARPPLRSIDELLARRHLRVALVRGFDYGDAYRTMLTTLQAQGRVYLQPDPQTVARMLADSMADVTIMPASVFIAGAGADARTAGLARRLRVEPLAELPWIRSGIYLSRTSLREDDRNMLEREIRASVRSGLWWQAMQRYYSRDMLNRSTRPITTSPPRR